MTTELAFWLLIFISNSFLNSVSSNQNGEGGFHWTISIVEHVKDHNKDDAWKLVKMVDVTCRRDACTDIYARIRALPDISVHGAHEFGRVTPGMYPRVLMRIKYKLKEELHIADAVVVKSDHCMCLQNSTFEWSAAGKLNSNCLVGTIICEMVFLLPVPITKRTTSFMITVESAETSLYIPRKSITFYNVNHHTNIKNVFKFETDVSLNSTFPAKLLMLQRAAESARFWVLPIGNNIILSSSEFETKRIAKISLPDHVLPAICNTWDFDVKGVLSLPDRIIVASKYGLLEYNMLDNGIPLSNPGLILSKCITELDATEQTSGSKLQIMAATNHSRTFYYGILTQGTPITMEEGKDSQNRTICDFLKSYHGCQVISLASSKNEGDKLYILVQADQYFLVQFSVENGSMTVINVLSHDKIRNSMLAKSVVESFILVGMSFTQLHAFHLFIWGNVFLYSPNAGQTVFKVVDLRDDIISLFETSHRGDFAYVTNTRKVFFGKVGTLSIRHLKSVNAAQSLTIFFDSSGDLFQLSVNASHCNSSTCIKKTKVPLREALRLENAYLKMINKNRFFSHNCHNDCAKSSVHADIDPVKSKKIERTCPFAKIKLKTSKFQFFSRISLTLHCRDKLNSEYATKLNQISPALFWTEKIKAGSKAFLNCLWEDSSHEEHYLPKSISLGRSSCYQFSIDVFLDHTDFADVYFHNYKLDAIKLSVIISKPEDLLLYFNSSTSYADNKVKFKVTLCDSGKKRKQYPPGVSQKLITPKIKKTEDLGLFLLSLLARLILYQVIGCGLNCISNSYEDIEDVQGYYTTKVLLGCPTGQKVVFDPKLTKKTGKAHFCDDDSSMVSCFHFDRVFTPVFVHVDEATLKTEVFSGNYTLVIVAGGLDLNNIRYFSNDEKLRYNFKAGSSLIWAPQQKYHGRPVFTKHSNTLSWLCGSNSPCSGIAPVFPLPPVFYFVIEFSNRDVDDSNCDFTFHFTIKVEGIAPVSINPSLIIVLVSIGLMIIGLVVYFFLKKRYNHVIERFQWTTFIRFFVRTNKVERSGSDNMVGEDGSEIA